MKWLVKMLIFSTFCIGGFTVLVRMTGSMESAVKWVIGIGVAIMAVMIVGFFNNTSGTCQHSSKDELLKRRARDQHRY